MDQRLIAPIVTDADRQWAIDQKPAWWDRQAMARAKRLSPKRPRPLAWETHVSDQADRFERHPAYVVDRKTPAEWSGIWRRVWWPAADPHVRFPETAPHEHDGEPHPFVRRGEAGWSEALALATDRERWLWERVGVAQFKPGDPRLRKLPASLSRTVSAA